MNGFCRIVLAALVVLLGVAALGCPNDDEFAYLQLYNHRNHPLTATLWVPREECGAFDAGAPERPRPEVQRLIMLPPESWTSIFHSCRTVRLTIAGAFDAVLTWSPLGSEGGDYNIDEGEPRTTYSVTVEGTRDELVVTLPKRVTAVPVTPGSLPLP